MRGKLIFRLYSCGSPYWIKFYAHTLFMVVHKCALALKTLHCYLFSLWCCFQRLRWHSMCCLYIKWKENSYIIQMMHQTYFLFKWIHPILHWRHGFYDAYLSVIFCLRHLPRFRIMLSPKSWLSRIDCKQIPFQNKILHIYIIFLFRFFR